MKRLGLRHGVGPGLAAGTWNRWSTPRFSHWGNRVAWGRRSGGCRGREAAVGPAGRRRHSLGGHVGGRSVAGIGADVAQFVGAVGTSSHRGGFAPAGVPVWVVAPPVAPLLGFRLELCGRQTVSRRGFLLVR